VKLGVSHHTLIDGNVQLEKQLVFVMDAKTLDEPETKKRKKAEKSKSGPNFKNFGAYLQCAKVKSSSKLTIGWRARRMLFGIYWFLSPTRKIVEKQFS
jgi:hypothetical protein